MKFLFPENYNFKNKLFGILDYPTAIFNVIYFLILLSLFNLLIKNINLKLFLLVLFYSPILFFSILTLNNESFLRVMTYIFKYFFNPKIYLYK
jgi:hypothetical protein